MMMIPLSLSLSIYIYIYIYLCVCVHTCTYAVYRLSLEFKQDFSYETTSIYTLNTRLSRRFDFKTRQEKSKSDNN